MANEERTLEDVLNSTGKWITKHITTIFAILISLFFIFSGTVKVLPTELGVKEQIVVAILNIFAGFSISSLVGEQGFTSAKQSQDFKDIRKEYNDSVKKAIKYRSAIDEFAKEKAYENLKHLRIGLCESVGLYYYDIFDDNGSLKKDFNIYQYKNDRRFRFTKLRIFKKAVKLKVQDYSVFSKSGSSKFGIEKRQTEKVYRAKKYPIKAIIKLVLGISSVGVMFVWIGFNLGSLVFAFAQVMLWTGMGVIDRLKNYNFIIEEIMPQYIDDRLVIDEFMEMSEEVKSVYVEKADLEHETIKKLPYRKV